MGEYSLGKLKEIDLREVWQNESGDFTPWLAEDQNIQLLSDAIGIELEVQEKDKSVGPYSADILCKDTTTSDWVLIENQLEKTDHTHLGQLLTYAAGLNAVTVIWISARMTDEHRSALDWLNEITDEQFNFFGIEIELWKIGDSELAPKFNIVSKPNDWAKTVKKANAGVNLTPAKLLQQEYWIAFREFMEEAGSKIRCQKPSAQHWMSHSIGRSGFHMQSIALAKWNTATNSEGSEIRAEVIVEDAGKYYHLLECDKDEIENELAASLEWINEEAKKSGKMYLRRDADISDRDDWGSQHQWIKDKLEALHKVFAPRIEQLSK